MLVLVGGPTGVGKTTLIMALAAQGCGVVHTLTTRPPRPGDAFKTSVSEEVYAKAAPRLFWPQQHLYGAFYGEDYATVMAAACPRNPRPWLIDAAPETLVIFDHVPHRRLILLPGDTEFLRRTLPTANRLERLGKAEEETVIWSAVAAADPGARIRRHRDPGTAAIACFWGQQAEIVALSRAHLARWAAADGEDSTP
jgi:hypothetical protein